ncbi:LuxR family transcriptional regulator, partial [Mycobacterium tuberculosis]
PALLACLASVLAAAGRPRAAVRLFGAAAAARGRLGAVRFGLSPAGCPSSLAPLRPSLGARAFAAAWAAGP